MAEQSNYSTPKIVCQLHWLHVWPQQFSAKPYDDLGRLTIANNLFSGYSGGGGGGGGALGGINPLAALIAPLAALALLGAAAAVAINPILVQLAVVSGRKRRDLTGVEVNKKGQCDQSWQLLKVIGDQCDQIWRNFEKYWQLFEGLISIWQTFEPTFWGNFWKYLGYFLFQHLVTLITYPRNIYIKTSLSAAKPTKKVQ